VPYNVAARVADPPDYVSYQEMFMPGAFNAQINAANRIDVLAGDARGILLNFEHGQSIGDVIGRGESLEERQDGLHGRFRIVNHPDGDKALELIHSGDLRGMSAEFVAKRSRTMGDGVVQRIDARIVGVALCRDRNTTYGGPKAGYPGAEILALRTGAVRARVKVKPNMASGLAVAVSRDGARALVSHHGGGAALVSLAGAGRVLALPLHDAETPALAFSPDGRRAFTGSIDGVVRMWDAGTGEEKLALTGHTGWVACLAFSADGNRIDGAWQICHDEATWEHDFDMVYARRD